MNGSPTVQRRRLGYLLRQFRTGLELTNRKVGDELERSESWVSRIETGESGIRLGELRALMDVYQITDSAVRTEMEALARGGRQRGWWSQYRSSLSNNYAAYIGFEASATRLLVYETLVVHGLLQTEAYARAVIRAAIPTVPADAVERRVDVRLKRQELLTRSSDPLQAWVVFDEAVLHRVIGGDMPAHLAQLDRLLDVARDVDNVRLQVIPFGDASNLGAMTGFTVLDFDGLPSFAYIEGLISDVYEEGEAAEQFNVGHADLRAAALSETSTIGLIKRIRDDLSR